MDGTDQHIIRRTIVDLQYAGNANGLELQKEFAEWCRNVLGPAIQQVLEAFDSTEEVIRIDSVSLNIDLETDTNWQDSLRGKIINQLKKNLQDRIIMPSRGVEVTTAWESFGGKLSYYLEHGIFPWNVPAGINDKLDALLKDWLHNINRDKLKDFLGRQSNERSLSRFVNLLDEKEFIRILGMLNEEITDWEGYFKDVYTIIRTAERIPSEQDRLLKRIRTELVYGLSRSAPTGIFDILKEFILKMDDREKLEIKNIGPGKMVLAEIRDLLKAIPGAPSAVLKKGKRKSAEEVTEDDEGRPGPGPDKEMEHELTEGVFIENAGAVIIAPFLPSLFSRTGLVKGNFLTDDAKALSLVHYCITGIRNPKEYELLLPRILCGVPTDTMIDPVVLRSRKMIVEADEMLSSVIEHWSVLKDTSIGGLREAFLIRNGELSFSNDEWILEVEQKAYDMLLLQLPWNITMIKLPWMKNILRTHWVL